MKRLVLGLVALVILSGCVPYKNDKGQPCIMSVSPVDWILMPAFGGTWDDLKNCQNDGKNET